MSDFRKLDIWRRARVLSTRVHHMVERLPPVERMRRGDQLIRSAISIRLNISEGSGYGSAAQFARYLKISLASANELDDGIEELDDVGLLPSEDRDLLAEPRELAAMIATFRKRVLGA